MINENRIKNQILTWLNTSLFVDYTNTAHTYTDNSVSS